MDVTLAENKKNNKFTLVSLASTGPFELIKYSALAKYFPFLKPTNI